MIIALSSLVIVSYIFTLISGKTRIPTVLLLLLLGIGIREALTLFGIYVAIPLELIQFFGVLGLILILLEAGLGLNMSKQKLPLVKYAAASSVFVLALSMAGIALVVHYILGQSWHISFVYAVPLSVISSTVVASSINYLSEAKREFLTYESSLSDIIGILVFNFLIAGSMFSVGLITLDIINVLVAVVASVVVSLLLLLLLTKTQVNIKAFLIFAVLLLMYALGHKWQMPTLLAVLIFGLIVNNWHLAPFRYFHKFLPAEEVREATSTIKSVTAESAFLIRTFFFTMFGYMIDVRVLGNV
ncbi:MAG: cation:proton antiporter, partial [bacterium]|nr:cation:proton antiporter [bacterium]